MTRTGIRATGEGGMPRVAGIVGLLTNDFVFISAGTDSAGNPSRVPNGRGWFLTALAALADSSSTVSYLIDRNLVAFPDSRPGRNTPWHKQVRTSLVFATNPSHQWTFGSLLAYFLGLIFH